ncbi:hypothetical protein Tco_0797295 [Tanacetum coccineum]
MSDDKNLLNPPPRGVDSYYRPGNFKDHSLIVYPMAANGTTTNFKIQPNLIAILLTFQGRANKEPYTYLREFFSIADTHAGSPPPSEEHVNRPYGSRPRNDPFSESYNPGWRNHPNFWWRNEDDTHPNNGQQSNLGYKLRYDSDENQELLEVEEVQQIEEHMVKSLDQQRQPWSYKVEALPRSFDTATKPSLETPPTLELKHLPSHLKIVTKPQIKPSQDAQRRLNPNMRDVVKNEDKEGCDNVVADHLSRITPPSFNHADAIKENFPDESLLSVLELPWYANIVNYLAVKKPPEHWSKQQKN